MRSEEVKKKYCVLGIAILGHQVLGRVLAHSEWFQSAEVCILVFNLIGTVLIEMLLRVAYKEDGAISSKMQLLCKGLFIFIFIVAIVTVSVEIAKWFGIIAI